MNECMELQSETILDLKAFNRLFGEYQQRFIRFAGTYVSDAATAEDIVMESFMAAWENAPCFPPPPSLPTRSRSSRTNA